MSSTVDSRIALAAMATALTAFTSSVGVSTATYNTSILSQGTADTGLTSSEKQIATAIGVSLGSTSASNSIHTSTNLSFGIDGRTLYTAMASVLTAFSSASSVTTATMATALTSMINIDTGLTAVESALITLFTSAIGSATPSTNTHSQV